MPRLPTLLATLCLLALGAIPQVACSGEDGSGGAPSRPPGEPGGSATAPAASGAGSGDGGAASSADLAQVVRAPRMDGDVVLIDVVEVREKLRSGAPLLVIDARGRLEFEQEHIPGAVNIPLTKIGAAAHLPGIARNHEIVVYCIAETCPISKNAARALAQLGYTNVRDMRAGLVGWKRAGFETASGSG